MVNKRRFIKILLLALLMDLIFHWKDAKNGMIDAWNENHAELHQKTMK
jgi:hypothetical protein